MRIILLVFFTALFAEPALSDIYINEIMFNPSGDDNNKEYIEIYSDSITNLTGYIIEDSDSSDTLQKLYLSNSSYSLIVEEGFNYTGINASIYSTGATIGNNLNNDGSEAIIFREPDSDIVDLVQYSDSWGADGNGKSLERVSIEGSSGDPSNWVESNTNGTPGRENSIAGSSGCDWTVLVITNGTVFSDPEFQIKAVKLNGAGKANLTISKWIEDSNCNIDEEYSPWNVENALNYQTSSKYSPNLAKGDAYFIKANITNVSCSDSNSSNNFVSQMIFVPGSEQQGTSSLSSIQITDVSPSDPEFGDAVKVSLNIYRGDTSKYAVYAYVEDSDNTVSEKATMHLKNKFTNYTLSVPVQLKPNCDEDYEDGSYDLVVEGLDVSDKEEIRIEGITSSLCKGTSGSSSSSSSGSADSGSSTSAKKFEYILEEFTKEVSEGQDVETKIKLTNNDDEDYTIEAWSYLYRSSKCYSGEREANKQSIILKAGNTETMIFTNKFIDAEPGDYNLKVKIRKNNQKTTYDLTENIKLVKEAEEPDPEAKPSKNAEEADEESDPGEAEDDYGTKLLKWSETVVYESTSFKSEKMLPYFFIAALAVCIIAIALTKDF